jgi:PAS domain S-box-containing protein
LFIVQVLLIGALLLQRGRQRRAEVALRHSEAKNQATLEAIPDVMFLIRADGVYLDYHARDQSRLYAPPEHFIGKRVVDIMPPDLADMFMRELSQAGRSETPRVVEYSLPIGGEERHYEARLVACESDKILSIVRDITDEKRTREEMLLSQTRYALATNAGGVGVWDWNLETSEFYIDPLFMEILGSREDAPNRFEGLLKHVHPSDRAETEERARACSDGRAPLYETEHRMLHTNGSVLWFQCRGSVVSRRDGRPSRVVGTYTDVTERRRIDAALRERESELRARHTEIQNLAGRLIAAQEVERMRIARDLHDDLSQKLALLMADVNQLGAAGGSAAGDLGGRIHEISRRADEIAADVHHLSHQLHPAKLEVLGLVAAIEGLCRDVTAQHQVEVQFRHQQVPSGVSPDVSLCLYRIAQESLRNVTRHSGATHASIELTGNDDVLRLQIADGGRGFETTDTRQAGLGLVSMRERVHFVGGQIVIHSAPGQGTRIGVRVPLLAPEQ